MGLRTLETGRYIGGKSILNQIDDKLDVILGRDIAGTQNDKLDAILSDKNDIANAIDLSCDQQARRRQDMSLYAKKIKQNSWCRKSDWIEMPAVIPSDSEDGDILTGLLFIEPDTATNRVSMQFTGDVTVDFGDGTVLDFESETKIEYTYDFSSIQNAELTSDGFKQVILSARPQAGNRITKCSTYFSDTESKRNIGFRQLVLSGSELTSAIRMFRGQTALESLEIVGENKIDNISEIVDQCISLKNLSIEFLDFALVGRYSLFYCRSLNKINIIAENITDATAFIKGAYCDEAKLQFAEEANCYSLARDNYTIRRLTLNSNPTNAKYMFWYAKSIERIDIDLEKSVNNNYMIKSAYNLTRLNLLNIKSTIHINDCTKLGKSELVKVFEALDADASDQTCNVTGCLGVNDLTDDDKAIATDKGWTLVL